MTIDLRILSFAILGKKLEKKLNTEEVKNEIRNGTATYKFADYCAIKLGNSPITQYQKDGKTIELDTAEVIANYCKANGIDIVKVDRPNYKVTFTPSAKAEKEFKKALNELEESEHRNLAKTAETVKNIM